MQDRDALANPTLKRHFNACVLRPYAFVIFGKFLVEGPPLISSVVRALWFRVFTYKDSISPTSRVLASFETHVGGVYDNGQRDVTASVLLAGVHRVKLGRYMMRLRGLLDAVKDESGKIYPSGLVSFALTNGSWFSNPGA